MNYRLIHESPSGSKQIRDVTGGESVTIENRIGEIVVSADGYRATSFAPAELPPEVDEYSVVLEVSSVRGTVRFRDGTPVGPGFTVLAWQRGDSMDASELLEIARTGNALSAGSDACRTDNFGRFELLEGSDCSDVVLLAAGPGYLQRGVERTRAATEDDVRLTVYPLYGCAVAIEVPNPLQGSLLQESALTVRRPKSAYYLHRSDPTPALAGVDFVEALSQPNRGAVLFALLESESPSIGPATARVKLPGCELASSEFMIPRISGNALEVVTLRPRDITPCRGSLEVSFVGCDWNGRQFGLSQALGRVAEIQLRPVDGSGAVLAIPVAEISPALLVVTGVPCGAYVWSFHQEHGRGPRSDYSLVEIASGVQSQIALDLSSLGTLMLECPGVPSQPVDLRLYALDRDGNEGEQSGGFTTIRAVERPIVIDGLLPGWYRIEAEGALLDRSGDPASPSTPRLRGDSNPRSEAQSSWRDSCRVEVRAGGVASAKMDGDGK